MNFVTSLPYLVVILILLQRTGQHWGCERTLDGETLTVGGKNFERLEGVSSQRLYHFLGRGTTVFPVLDPNDKKAEYVMKIYWPEVQRRSEAEIIELARNMAKKVASPATPEMITNHLPCVIAHQDFFKTSELDEVLGIPPVAPRVMRAIVFKKLNPITNESGPKIVKPFLETIQCKCTINILRLHDLKLSNHLCQAMHCCGGSVYDMVISVTLTLWWIPLLDMVFSTTSTSRRLLIPNRTLMCLCMEMIAQGRYHSWLSIS